MFSKALVCFLIVLAGCGSATSTHQRSLPLPTPTGEIAKPATEILADARRELLAAGSVRVHGTVSQSVAAKTSVQQRLDLRVGRGPGGEAEASGTITTIASAGGQTLTVPIAVIRVGPRLYIYGDKSYYARISAKAVRAAGHWLLLPISQDQAFAGLTDVTQFAAGLASTVARTGGEVLLATVPVVVVRTASALVYVAAGGAPRLLRLQRPAAANALAGTLDFSEYGATLAVQAPAGAIALQTLLQ